MLKVSKKKKIIKNQNPSSRDTNPKCVPNIKYKVRVSLINFWTHPIGSNPNLFDPNSLPILV